MNQSQRQVMEIFQLSEIEWLSLLLLPTVEDRLARLLHHMKLRGIARVGQLAMAAACNVTRETISRVLVRWLREERVRRTRPGNVGRACYEATPRLRCA